MSGRFAITFAFAALAFCAARTAGAQPPEKPADKKPPANLELTMTLLPEHAKGPEEITRRIELPPPKAASGEHKEGAEENGSHNDAGRPSDPGEQGRSNAEQARELGREFGQERAEEARENRDNAVHNPNAGGNGGGGKPPGRP